MIWFLQPIYVHTLWRMVQKRVTCWSPKTRSLSVFCGLKSNDTKQFIIEHFHLFKFNIFFFIHLIVMCSVFVWLICNCSPWTHYSALFSSFGNEHFQKTIQFKIPKRTREENKNTVTHWPTLNRINWSIFSENNRRLECKYTNMKDVSEILCYRSIFGRNVGVLIGTIASIYIATKGFQYIR